MTRLRIFLSAVFLGLTSGTLIDILTQVHRNPAFNSLPHGLQIMIIELISETEAGELKQYIDLVGFHNVIATIDKLPQSEAHLLRQYLIKELQIEEGNTTQGPPVVGKRDLIALLKAVEQNPAFQHLSLKDQTFIERLLTAAENNTLTSYIGQVGYSAILELVDILPATEGHALNQYIFQHIKNEMGTSVGKK